MTLIIRNSQTGAFARTSTDQFFADAIDYLDRALGGNTAFYGEDAVLATIRYGIKRAESYGITGQHDVCLYLRLMFTLLGSDFDRDPLYPWAGDILNDTYYPPNEKIMRLASKADEVLGNIQVNEPQYFKRVLAATRNNLFLHLPSTADLPLLEGAVLAEIRHWFPGKLACVGEENAKRLIERGMIDARALGIQQGPDAAAFIQFMFIYGARFYSDPKYPQSIIIFSEPQAIGTAKIAAMFAQTREFLLRKLHLLRAQ